MSYILEALKKSEQERNPDRVPDLSTHHEHVAQPAQKSFPWLWLVIALVLCNLFVVYWLFFKQGSVQTVQPVAVEQQAEPAKTVQPTVVEQKVEPEPEPVEPEPAQVKETIVKQPVVVSAPAPQPIHQQVQPEPRVLGFNELPHVSELSLAIQNQLPSLAFSTHIYVEDGGSFVIINNKNLSNGSSLGNGLVLERIVREGVIFSYRNRYFTLNSMESWSN
jgi:general secretion pathway protein B